MPLKTTQKTKVIQTRLDAELVDQANYILDNIGITATDLMRILLKKVVNTGKIPITLEFHENEIGDKRIQNIEKTLDDYYAGNLKTTTVANKKDLKELLSKMAE